jgi:hypothetical protein
VSLSKKDCRLSDMLIEFPVVQLKQSGTLISWHAEQQTQHEA